MAEKCYNKYNLVQKKSFRPSKIILEVLDMTLASKLTQIKGETDRAKKDTLINEFLDLIDGHPEQNLLLNGLEQAEQGRGFIDYGRAVIMPETLKDEGFVLVAAGAGFHIRFDKKEGEN